MPCLATGPSGILYRSVFPICILAISFAAAQQTIALGQSTFESSAPVPSTHSPHGLQTKPASAAVEVSPRRESQSSFAAPLFLPGLLYGPISSLSAVAVGDVNGDGKLDVVVGTYGEVQVLIGNGDGTLTPAGSYPPGGGPLVLADLRGNGKLDVVVIGPLHVATGVNILLGNGDGTFGSPVNYLSDQDIFGLAVGDVNGDGKPDIVVISYLPETDNQVTILLGNGDGTFQSPVTYDSGGSGFAPSVAIADMNGDGIPDIVVANACTPATGCDPSFPPPTSVGVMLGTASGRFLPAVNYLSANGYSFGCGEPNAGGPLYVADFNGDGKLDVAVFSPGCGLFSVMLGNGDGSLQAGVTYSPPTYECCLAVADANGDGIPDLMVPIGGYNYPASVAIYEGNGDGTFQPPTIVPTNGGDNGIAAGDLSGNGKPDLVVGNGSTAAVSVLMNNTGGAPPATTLASSPAPSAYGQNVTLTALVSSPLAVPTGTVNFLSGTTILGSSSLSNGVATLNVSSLTAGSHSLGADYQGSGSFYASKSARIDQFVKKAKTSTVITSSADPGALNKTINLFATVNSEYGALTTGTVTFTANSQTLGTASVYEWGGISTTFSADGDYSIVATYSGDANNRASTSQSFTQYIDSITSRTTLTSSPSPSQVGTPVTLTAQVTSAKASVPNGDTVTFYDGDKLLGTATTVDGVATISTSAIPYGIRSLTANFPGDPVLLPSAGHVRQVVDRWTTSTTITSSPNPSSFKQAVTFTVTVTSTGPNTPTGKVAIFDNGPIYRYVTLVGGVAQYEEDPSVGSHQITAEYAGDSDSAKSTSPLLIQVVN